MTITELIENYINGNITDTKKRIKRLNKYEIVQFVFALQDAGINDRHIEKLFY
jgi:hypothetical protein